MRTVPEEIQIPIVGISRTVQTVQSNQTHHGEDPLKTVTAVGSKTCMTSLLYGKVEK